MLRPDQLRALTGLGVYVVGVAATPRRGAAVVTLNDNFVVDVEGKYLAFLDAHGAAGIIMRPDSYVFGGASKACDLARLTNELTAALAENGVHVSAEADLQPDRRAQPREALPRPKRM